MTRPSAWPVFRGLAHLPGQCGVLLPGRLQRGAAAHADLSGFRSPRRRKRRSRRILRPTRPGFFEPYRLEKRYVRKDGQTVLGLATTVAPVFAASGEPSCFLAMVENVSERKRAEDVLRASEEMFRQLIEGAPAAVFGATRGADYLRQPGSRAAPWSEPLLRTRWSLGAWCRTGIHPGSLNALGEGLHHPRPAASSPLEAVLLKLDGSEVPVEVSVVSICLQSRTASLVRSRHHAATDRKPILPSGTSRSSRRWASWREASLTISTIC